MKLNSGWAQTGTGGAGAEVVAAASAVGAAAVLHPTDLIDCDTAKASASQGQPPTAGVIPSHDHCSHTCITVTVEQEGRKEGRRELGPQGSSDRNLFLVTVISPFIRYHHNLSKFT